MVTMSMNHPLLLLLLFLPILLPLASSLTETLPINVWPKPINISWPTLSAAPLSPSFTILSPYPNHPNLAASIARYSRLILSERYRPIVPPAVALATSYPLLSLTLSISDPSAALQHGVDESYTLTISTTGDATLSAATVWGAMRGLETFSQLTWGGDPTIVATGVQISDRPIFKHRGIMLDTSRNYYPVDDILRTIGAMSANKLNVFHWHITDSHSFPLVLPSEPALAAKGSYDPGRQYSPTDVKTIVDFGLDHGVRVMPEFDMPGHTASWAGAYPDIITCANMFWLPNASDATTALAAEPGTGQLNPLNPKTYAVVRNVIRDAAALFPEPFFHAGADEINPNCWKSDPLIQSFLAVGGTLGDALEQFVNTTHPHIVSLNRTVVYWEDILLNPTINVSPSLLPPSTTILQTWNNGPNNTKRIVAAGYRAIVSSSDFYFLDCGHGDFVGNDSFYDGVGSDVGTDGRSWCGPYKTWQRVYDYDVTYGLSAAEAELVMGGEVAMWSEQADAAVVDGRMWPRAAAMAEAMWSGNRGRGGEKRYAEATDRIFDWRERMVGRGVRAEPIQPLWCRSRPGMCNLVH